MMKLKNELLELATKEGLKVNVDTAASLASFWRKVKNEDLELAEIALKCLFSLSTSLCKTNSSTMSVIKTKQ